ncbi:flagellar assembly protein T N-terminal domain-containing protein, partial [Photobacterium sp. OFAV2-7]|uniref:flagellar assembly protein T N-terminal domain-containing protein n=1 Tax=Photobacterium sp. OFAV2-7 TaxID=2917748 RepID=UPI001EF498E0
MNKKIINTLSSLCLMAAFQLNAAWLEVTGSAVMLESEKTARTNALEDAVYQAMGYAGADLASFPKLKPFLASVRDEYQFSGNEVRHVMVTETR